MPRNLFCIVALTLIRNVAILDSAFISTSFSSPFPHESSIGQIAR